MLLVRKSIFVRWGSPFPIVLVPRYKLSLCHTPIKPDLLCFPGIGVFAVKLDSCTFYIKIPIWPCMDRIIPSLFKMIRPLITNKLNGQFLSLLLKPLEFFSCQQSSPTTLDESCSRSILYIITTAFSSPLFLKLVGHWLLPLTHQVLASSPLEYGIDSWILFLEH